MVAADDTSNRILDAAEKLFGAQGLDATSVRQIAQEAAVNLAAISYHFGGKEALYEAVFLRRIRPVNAARLALLDIAQASPSPALESYLDAFIRPTLLLGTQHPAFLAVMSRNLFAPPQFMAPKIAAEFEPLVARFRPALRAALPHLPPAEIFWRMHFMVGSVIYTTSHFATIERMAVGVTKDVAIESTIQRLVSFCAAGLKQPVPPESQPVPFSTAP